MAAHNSAHGRVALHVTADDPFVWRHQPFLRDGVAGEESRQMRESVGALAQAIDEAVRARRARKDTAQITRRAAALAQGVRDHQFF